MVKQLELDYAEKGKIMHIKENLYFYTKKNQTY
jgi:hypothetical protein